jgi:YesN/AraC family two-component response regulator
MIDDSRTIDENIGILLDRCRIILDLRSQEQRKFKNLSTEIVLNYIRENYYKPISLSIIALILKLV